MGATAAPILAGTLARIWARRDHVAGGGGQRPVISGRTFLRETGPAAMSAIKPSIAASVPASSDSRD
jgi:hypothetical protein